MARLFFLLVTSAAHLSVCGRVHRQRADDTLGRVTEAEKTTLLNLHNKFRCLVGSPELTWNDALAARAQNWAGKCHSKLTHSSNSFRSNPKAGENLAGGKNVTLAVWMWASEYVIGQPILGFGDGAQGHWTAVVWKSTTELGCGKCRTGRGQIVCHYANSQPNVNVERFYKENVPRWNGLASKFTNCKLDPAQMKEIIDTMVDWRNIDSTRVDQTMYDNLGVTKPKDSNSRCKECMSRCDDDRFDMITEFAHCRDRCRTSAKPWACKNRCNNRRAAGERKYANCKALCPTS